MVRFETPENLALLAIIPIALLFLIWRAWVRTNTLRQLGDADLIHKLTRRVSRFRRALKESLWLLAIACIAVALARPVWGEELVPIRSRGVQIVFVVDVSLSMNAQDLIPSRLERARLDLRAMIDSAIGNEIGIVLFAYEAFTYMPLTDDTRAAQVFVQAIQPEAVSAQGTSLARAIERALNTFEAQSAAPRILILLSDGEDHEGLLESVLARAVREGVTIHTIGYGTEPGAVIPIRSETGQVMDYKTDAGGTLIETRLNRSLLRQIAEQSGGQSFVVNSPGSGIDDLLTLLRSLASNELEERIQRIPVLRSAWFATFSAILLLISLLVSDARRAESA